MLGLSYFTGNFLKNNSGYNFEMEIILIVYELGEKNDSKINFWLE